MRDLSADGYRPAKGLSRLTWPQVEMIDAMVGSLCGLTETEEVRDREMFLILVVRNGKLRFGTTTEISEELKPGRS